MRTINVAKKNKKIDAEKLLKLLNAHCGHDAVITGNETRDGRITCALQCYSCNKTLIEITNEEE